MTHEEIITLMKSDEIKMIPLTKEINVVNQFTAVFRNAKVVGLQIKQLRQSYLDIRDENEKLKKKSKSSLPKELWPKLEEAYKFYPNKVEKSLGMVRLKRTLKTQKDCDELMIAIQNYANWCRDNNKEKKHIKHFPTWVNHWRDWIKAPKSSIIQEHYI